MHVPDIFSRDRVRAAVCARLAHWNSETTRLWEHHPCVHIGIEGYHLDGYGDAYERIVIDSLLMAFFFLLWSAWDVLLRYLIYYLFSMAFEISQFALEFLNFLRPLYH